jgi:hypothetical protein
MARLDDVNFGVIAMGDERERETKRSWRSRDIEAVSLEEGTLVASPRARQQRVASS